MTQATAIAANNTQADLIRELDEMNQKGAKFPYAKRLKKEFNVEIPEGAPLYQLEYLYKYGRQALTLGMPLDQAVAYATKKAEELFKHFPWLVTKYEQVKAVKEKVAAKVAASGAPVEGKRLPEKCDLPDGTTLFCEKRGIYVMYLGGAIAVRSKTVDKVVELAKSKLNFEGVILPKA